MRFTPRSSSRRTSAFRISDAFSEFRSIDYREGQLPRSAAWDERSEASLDEAQPEADLASGRRRQRLRRGAVSMGLVQELGPRTRLSQLCRRTNRQEQQPSREPRDDDGEQQRAQQTQLEASARGRKNDFEGRASHEGPMRR